MVLVTVFSQVGICLICRPRLYSPIFLKLRISYSESLLRKFWSIHVQFSTQDPHATTVFVWNSVTFFYLCFMRDIHHVCCYGNWLADVSSQACQNGGKRSKISKRNQDNGQPQNFDASVLRSVISSLIKKEDNRLSKSAFLSRKSNFNKSNCLSSIFVDHSSAHSLTVRFLPMTGSSQPFSVF